MIEQPVNNEQGTSFFLSLSIRCAIFFFCVWLWPSFIKYFFACAVPHVFASLQFWKWSSRPFKSPYSNTPSYWIEWDLIRDNLHYRQSSSLVLLLPFISSIGLVRTWMNSSILVSIDQSWARIMIFDIRSNDLKNQRIRTNEYNI